ncbi:TIGR04282 family arsenosugar biosynthesis glycosyltransferase [Enterococcus xiangfangensis]|uniref:TIGR04282 family arsenosugar biosynthesis glycosyltransferase n=1 Tax=Enterococcus xiangfangensis TaxID=1296537 RepID=A0ABU3FCE9_9ENTE|nr:TIGR04282 family arsenosugar biosynthesis glycosyltransferase [Enterococcus xiangfangensis]MBM7711583.1 rSAM/selenodomain-associated transferase 1 [Enterococcus xiangfangensis]MDT2760353.1 TIGR04282 family arsenosugar biosynthesis glycosyltransferase [Enterococcus xiangfangensis]
MNKYAYILFTRVPVPNKVKTRLQSLLSGEEACQVQRQILQDSFTKFGQLSTQGIDLYLAYSDEGDPAELFSAMPESFHAFEQRGKTIGQRMNHALKFVFAKGYEKVVLTGSDIPNLNAHTIQSALDQMQDVVIGPSSDGGYYLIGSRYGIDLTPIFETDIVWGKNEVLKATLQFLTAYDVALLSPLQDIDYPADLKRIYPELRTENSYLLQWLEKNRGVLE